MGDGVEKLLEGPRGRRLCWELLVSDTGPVPSWAWGVLSGESVDAPSVATELARIEAAERVADAALVMRALVAAVDAAWYWQAPEDLDVLLAQPVVRRALVPAARALTTAQTTAWWTRSVQSVPQHYVQWIYDVEDYPQDPPPLLQGAAERVQRWRAEALATEQRHRPRRFRRRVDSGEWWSTPGASGLVASQLVTTTGPGTGLPAVGLVLVEDAADPSSARLWPLAPDPQARVYEITEPADWAHLAETYPLDLSWSKDPDWSTITGETGPWIIPDWATVGQDYDGVHLTVTGWLTTAGRAVPAGAAHTVVAGWDPDTTWWLTDSLHPHGEPTDWYRAADEYQCWALHKPA
jgi:hypothetical protein